MKFEFKKNIKMMRNYYEKECTQLRKEVSELRQKLNGERICGNYCRKCVHSITKEITDYTTFESRTIYECLLECKCKDFKHTKEPRDYLPLAFGKTSEDSND